jgi:hypothetical protein
LDLVVTELFARNKRHRNTTILFHQVGRQ